MAARKTIAVKDVLSLANAMLAHSDDDKTDGRISVAILVERVLMDTDNYKGFCYTDGNEGRTDDTRRHYYMPGSHYYKSGKA